MPESETPYLFPAVFLLSAGFSRNEGFKVRRAQGTLTGRLRSRLGTKQAYPCNGGTYLRLREWKATPRTKGAPTMTMPEPSMLSGCPQQYMNFRTIPAIGTAASAIMSLVAIG